MASLPTPGVTTDWGDDLNAAIRSMLGADETPTSPSAYDDEFDGTSSVTWTATPTAPATMDVNTTRPGHLYVRASGTASALVGRYQTCPGSYPFIITAKIDVTSGRANYHRGGGIFIGPASPTSGTAVVYFGHNHNTGDTALGHTARRIKQTLGGTLDSQGNLFVILPRPLYLKMVVASATSVSFYASNDGYTWTAVETGYNPGFTPGVMGMICNEESAGGGVHFAAEYFRVANIPNQNLATLRGAPTYSAGKFGNALSGGVLGGGSTSWDSPVGTVEAWVKTTGTSTAVAVGNNGAATNGLWIGQSGTKAGFGLNGSPAQTSSATINDGAWHHLAITVDGVNAKLWVDGALALTVATTSKLTFGAGTNAVGGFGAATGFDWAGQVDEVRISSAVRYTAAFTPPSAAFTVDADTTSLYHLESDGSDSAVS